jgi:hypothetical protein
MKSRNALRLVMQLQSLVVFAPHGHNLLNPRSVKATLNVIKNKTEEYIIIYE